MFRGSPPSSPASRWKSEAQPAGVVNVRGVSVGRLSRACSALVLFVSRSSRLVLLSDVELGVDRGRSGTDSLGVWCVGIAPGELLGRMRPE